MVHATFWPNDHCSSVFWYGTLESNQIQKRQLKGKLVTGSCKPTCRNCAVYFLPMKNIPKDPAKSSDMGLDPWSNPMTCAWDWDHQKHINPTPDRRVWISSWFCCICSCFPVRFVQQQIGFLNPKTNAENFGEKLDEFNSSLILVICDLFFVHWCIFPKNPGMSQEKDCPSIPILRMGLEPMEGSGFVCGCK